MGGGIVRGMEKKCREVIILVNVIFLAISVTTAGGILSHLLPRASEAN